LRHLRHLRHLSALRHIVCKENRVEKRQEPLSLPLQMPVMLLNGELKAALLILSSRSRSHLGPPVTGGATRCANWLASCVPAARKVTKSHVSSMGQHGCHCAWLFLSMKLDEEPAVGALGAGGGSSVEWARQGWLGLTWPDLSFLIFSIPE